MLFRLRPVALAILCLPATAALAESEVQLGTVNVTARGTQADTLDTPQAVAVIAPEAADAGAPAGALFRGQPGLAVQTDGAWGQNPVIRGLKKESVVVLVDGVRLNSAQPYGSIASLLDVGLLERAEVVKGPSSVLYGSGALGGTVNFITAPTRFTDTPTHGGQFSLGASSADSGVSGAALYRFGSPDHALVVGVAAKEVDDYDSPSGTVDRTGYSTDDLLFKYAFRVSSATELHLNLQRHSDHDVWYPGSARTGGQAGGAGIPALLGTVTIHSPEQHRELIEGGIKTELGSGTLMAEVYRQEVFRQIRAWSDSIQRNYVRNDVTFVTHGARGRYLLPIGDDHVLTVGAETWQMTGDPARYMDNNAPLFNNNVRNDPFSDGEITSTGLFVQDEMRFGATQLVAGLRVDQVQGDAAQKGTATTGLDKTDNTVSWTLGAIHAVSPLLNPYINIGSAYRAADMRERFEDAARGDGYYHVGNPQLDPERSTSIEIGLKGRNASLDYNLALFHTRIDDYIAGRVTGSNAPNGLPIKLTENLDQVVIYGAEGSLSVPVGRYVADAGFTWLRGDNKQDDEPLAEMPPPEVRLGFGQPAEQGFYWRAQVRAVARQDRVATIFTNGGENETAGFVTADAAFGWRFGKLGGLKSADLGVKLSNLFDREYHEHTTLGLSGQEIAATGRNITVTLSGSF